MSKMILIDEATVKLALEALEYYDKPRDEYSAKTARAQDVKAMNALRETLAENPAQRTWVRLTDDLKRAIESMIESHEVGDLDGWEVQLVKRRLHEATNGIKEQP